MSLHRQPVARAPRLRSGAKRHTAAGQPPEPETQLPAVSTNEGHAEESLQIEAILAFLRRGQHFLIASHAMPDGDAVGSMLAMSQLLQQMGKSYAIFSADWVPAIYRGLPGASEVHVGKKVGTGYDAAILLECDGTARTRLLGLEQFPLVNIDHHASGQNFGVVNWIDSRAVSCGELVHRLMLAAGATITPAIATCLYTTILTDTGSFRHGSLRAETFELARDLVRAGADPVGIAQQVYYSTAASRLRLQGAALSNLMREGRIAWLWITRQDILRTCAAEEDCEGIVNFALAIGGVEAAVFLREMTDGRIRLSLRSKGKIDVAHIAEELGGGGHACAAGCTLPGPLTEAIDRILGQLRPAVARLEPATSEIDAAE